MPCPKPTPLALLTLLLAASAAALPAEPPALLLPPTAPADGQELSRRELKLGKLTSARGVRRSRLMRLNRDALAALAAASSPAGSSLRLDLFPEVTEIVRIDKVAADSRGFVVYQGRIEGDPLGGFNLVLHQGVAAGTVDGHRRFFRLTHVADDLVAVLEVDRSAFPNEAQPRPQRHGGGRDVAAGATAAGQTEFDVLILYTTAAQEAAGGVPQMQAQAGLAISQLNQAFANSSQQVAVTLAGIAGVAYQETGNPDTDLTWLSGDSIVANLRSAWDADVVSLVVSQLSACGIGYLMRNVSTAFAADAFNVVELGCAITNYSFAHEVGHNIGCNHDRANATGQGAYDYSYGYQAPDSAFRTILAYDCATPSCSRVLYYSNPDVILDGEPTGVDPDAADSADNALTAANTAPTVAQFSTRLPDNTFGGYDVNSGQVPNFDPGYPTWPRYLVDVNDDDRADYCRFVGSAAKPYLDCAFASASSFGNYDLGPSGNFDQGYPNMPRLMADVNADGRADYCRMVGNAPKFALSCALASASGFGNYDVWSGSSFDPGYSTWPAYLVDVNDDDRADYCRFVGSAATPQLSCAFAPNPGAGVTTFGNYDLTSGTTGFDLGLSNLPRFMADVNADGRADYCRFVGNPPAIAFSCALASATGFGNYDVNSGQAPVNFDPGYSTSPMNLVDVNADDCADFCRFVGDPPFVFLSCALATTSGTFGNYDVNSLGGYDAGIGGMLQAMADVNADNKGDYCRFVGNQPAIALSCGLAEVAPAPAP